MKTEETTKKRRQWKIFSAKEKSKAVLSLWSGRRSASAICAELATSWGAVHGWELRALEGMMEALEPGWKKDAQEGIRLGSRIEKLLETMVRDAAGEQVATVETK